MSRTAAPVEEVMKAWAGLGYYARARNLHACAIAVTQCHGGAFPQSEAELLALPGIGPYTAAAVALVRRLWLRAFQASAAAPPPRARNGSIGMPGSSASTSITPADMPSACG